MKRVNAVKVILDIAITIGFLLLMEPKATGLSLHEWGGLGICVFFVVHKLLNWSWIKAVTTGFFSKKVPASMRLGYVVDVLLLVGFSLIAISGMGMAKTIDFTWLLARSGAWKGLHAAASFLTLAAVGIHLGLHARWIGNRARGLAALLAGGKAIAAPSFAKGDSDAR